ncbi:MAG: PAS domain S-box protein [Chloroflexi bacterium]|nr:PAS domain S-box protein [Chloroflexota bacterium]
MSTNDWPHEPERNTTAPGNREQVSLSEEQFRLLIENALDAITVLNGDGTIRYQSPAVERILGYAPEDMVGKAISEFVHPDDLPDLARTFDDVLQGPNATPPIEVRFQHQDGSWHILESICSKLAESTGAAGIVVNARDVTERNQAEQELRESEARWRSLTETSPDHILTVDTDLNIQFANYASPGLTVQDLIGSPLYNYVQEERRTEIKGILEGVLKTGESARYETEYDTPDSSKIYYESYVVPRVLADQVIGLTLNARDITERKMSEKAIRRYAEEQALLYTVALAVAAMPGVEEPLFALLDVVLPVLDADAGWVTLPGPTLNDPPHIVAWRGVSDAFIQAEMAAPLCDCPVCLPLLSNGKAQAKPVLVSGCPRLPPKTLADSNLHSHVAIPLSAGDSVLGVLEVGWRAPYPYSEKDHALLTAIGQQMGVALENVQLQQHSQQLAVMEERQRLSRELHDSVTQSVYSLTLFAEAGQEWAEAGDLDRIQHNLTRIGEIAQQALKDMRLLVYELQPSHLEKAGLIGALRHRLNAVEKRAGVEARLLTDYTIELPESVEQALYGIAQEALNNALKHADANSVTVHMHVSDGHVELEIVDDGKGFDPDAAGDKGGLGLTTMQERAEKEGGTLTILSVSGKGTQVKADIELGKNCQFPASEATR